jgi:hypothetical protein
VDLVWCARRVSALSRKASMTPATPLVGVNAFHEKAGRSQVGSVVFSFGQGFYRRVAAVATLPSALLVSDFRSVQVGRSRFSRCCHLIVDLPFHS